MRRDVLEIGALDQRCERVAVRCVIEVADYNYVVGSALTQVLVDRLHSLRLRVAVAIGRGWRAEALAFEMVDKDDQPIVRRRPNHDSWRAIFAPSVGRAIGELSTGTALAWRPRASRSSQIRVRRRPRGRPTLRRRPW